MQGDTGGAYEAVQQGLHEDALYPNSFQPLLLVTLCYLQWCSADLDDLAASATRVINLDRRGVVTGTLARAYHYLGCACYQQNRLDEAAAAFGYVLRHQQGVHSLVIAQSGFGLAATLQAAGAPEQARSVAALGGAHALRFSNPAILALDEAFAAQLALRQGRPAEAARWAERAERARIEGAMPTFFVGSLALAEVLLNSASPADLEAASVLLARLHEAVTSAKNTRFLIDVLALRALLFNRLGDEDAALETLARAVTLAQPGGVARVFIDLGPEMAQLLAGLELRPPVQEFVAYILDLMPFAAGQQDGPLQRANILLPEMLTRREMEVLHLLAQRLSSREIGDLLGISYRTAKRHTENICQKLGVNSRQQAVAAAINIGLLPPDPAAPDRQD